MGELTVGVLGYGYWGSKHVRVLNGIPDVDVVVIENHIDRLAAAGAAFPGLTCVADLDKALEFVDAIVIATAASSHAAMARRCLEAGVHVMVEKPLTTCALEARGLIKLAEERGLVLMVGHTFEYNAAVHVLRDLVQSGELGTIRYIDTARLNLGLYQADVNVMWDLAPHDISIVNYLLGSAPTHVSAWARSHVPTQVEDVAYLQLEYAEPDTRAYVHVSWLDPKKVRRVTVVGSEKMAVYNDVDPNEPIRIYDMGVDESQSLNPDRPVSYRVGDILSPRVSGPEPLLVEDEHFVDCVRRGLVPRSDGRSGLAVVAAIEAAERSAAAAGARVSIDTVPALVEHAA
jgi:predicted dehydrogenase